MPRLIVNPGDQFGRLTAIREVPSAPKTRLIECVCECGTTKLISLYSLLSNKTRSCGCLFSEIIANGTHHTHSLSGTREHIAWKSAKTRCFNKSIDASRNYSERGISMYEPWVNDFEAFLAYIGPCPPGMTLDRWPNNNGNYEPGNVRWASMEQQNCNKRSNVLIEFGGRTQCISHWDRELGLSQGTVAYRLRVMGLPLERALTSAKGRWVEL